jgi:hypothetical protein
MHKIRYLQPDCDFNAVSNYGGESIVNATISILSIISMLTDEDVQAMTTSSIIKIPQAKMTFPSCGMIKDEGSHLNIFLTWKDKPQGVRNIIHNLMQSGCVTYNSKIDTEDSYTHNIYLTT